MYHLQRHTYLSSVRMRYMSHKVLYVNLDIIEAADAHAMPEPRFVRQITSVHPTRRTLLLYSGLLQPHMSQATPSRAPGEPRKAPCSYSKTETKAPISETENLTCLVICRLSKSMRLGPIGAIGPISSSQNRFSAPEKSTALPLI